QSRESKRRSTRAAKEHHKVYNILNQSNREWTIVCPTYLTDGERLGKYRIEQNFLPEGGAKISVPDTAEFVVSQLKATDYI
ncbi:NAD(P)H-binding protein, partial [Escherichia coli]|nr:NAD(P)H-binding protein [Escherichia coli]